MSLPWGSDMGVHATPPMDTEGVPWSLSESMSVTRECVHREGLLGHKPLRQQFLEAGYAPFGSTRHLFWPGIGSRHTPTRSSRVEQSKHASFSFLVFWVMDDGQRQPEITVPLDPFCQNMAFFWGYFSCKFLLESSGTFFSSSLEDRPAVQSPRGVGWPALLCDFPSAQKCWKWVNGELRQPLARQSPVAKVPEAGRHHPKANPPLFLVHSTKESRVFYFLRPPPRFWLPSRLDGWPETGVGNDGKVAM